MIVRASIPRSSTSSRSNPELFYPAVVARRMGLTKHAAVALKAAICFGCNQSFDGNPVGYRYDSDLVGPSDRAELTGLIFHEGHLYRYARRRGWTPLADEIARRGDTRF